MANVDFILIRDESFSIIIDSIDIINRTGKRLLNINLTNRLDFVLTSKKYFLSKKQGIAYFSKNFQIHEYS